MNKSAVFLIIWSYFPKVLGGGGGRGRLTPFGLKLGKYLNPLGLT